MSEEESKQIDYVPGHSRPRRGGALKKDEGALEAVVKPIPKLDLKSSMIPPQSTRFQVRIGLLEDVKEIPRTCPERRVSPHTLDRGEPRPASPRGHSSRGGALPQEGGD